MGRYENIQVFEDTMSLCESDGELAAAVENSIDRQYVLRESDKLALEAESRGKPAEIVVSRRRSFEAAMRYGGKRVCVLNFASAKNAGGGVANGASAQEECLCRVSTLYPCLADDRIFGKFYAPHRRMFRDTLYNGDLICTPSVVCVKSDAAEPKTLPKDKRFALDVVTCAAPNLGTGIRISDDELEKLHYKRLERVFITAANEGAEVLILGAFGCGAFRNPPRVVASAMRKLTERYAEYFDTIEFAVYCTPRASANYDEFAKAFPNALK